MIYEMVDNLNCLYIFNYNYNNKNNFKLKKDETLNEKKT